MGLGVLSIVAVVAGWGVVRRTPLDLVLAIFYATLLLSTLASGHPLEAVAWGPSWVVLAYFVVVWWTRDGAHVVRLVRLVVLAGAISGAYGIAQHFTGIDWYRALLGRPTQVARRGAGDSGYAVVGFYRSYLTFAHTMIPPFAWAGAGAVRGGRGAAVAAALLVVAIVFSTARGAWIAALVVGGTLVALAAARRAVGVAVALAVLGGAVLATSPALRLEAQQMFALGGVNAGRLGIYRANLEIVHEHPLFGLGFGRYRTAARPYYDRHPDADRRSHAHNNYLQMGAEAGLLGLAAFMLVYAVALRDGLVAVRGGPGEGEWAAAAGAWAAIVGFLVGGVTQYTFGDGEVAIAMWVAMAVLARLGEEATRA